MAQAAQIDGKHLSQVHARSQANCLKFTPRYIEQRRFARNNAEVRLLEHEKLEGRVKSLEELVQAIRLRDPNLPWNDYGGLNLDGLPTFGGATPKVLEGIYSWDRHRLLVRIGEKLEIIGRRRWGGELLVTGDPYLGEDPYYAASWRRRTRVRTWSIGVLEVILFFTPMLLYINLVAPLIREPIIFGLTTPGIGHSIIKFLIELLLPLSFFAGFGAAWLLEKALGVRYGNPQYWKFLR